MLINVFGEWINHTSVLGVTQDRRKDGTSYIIISDIRGGGWQINHKTEDEVANEINRQIILVSKNE